MTTVYLCWLAALDRVTAGTRVTITVHAAEDSLSFEIGGCESATRPPNDRVEALGGELVSSGGRVAVSLPI